MIEPELAFADLNDDMACSTAYLQFVVCYLPTLLTIKLPWSIDYFTKVIFILFLHIKLVCYMYLFLEDKICSRQLQGRHGVFQYMD